MLSEEDTTLKLTLQYLAKKIIKDGKTLPTKIKRKLAKMEKLVFNGDFSINIIQMLLAECMSILTNDFNIEATACRRVFNNKIKNAKIYEYEFRMQNGDFFYLISMTKVGNNFLSSLQALSDALVGFRGKTGCELCKYSEEGCLHCGLNKLRKILREDPNIRTFKETGSVLINTLGDKLDPVFDLIDWYVENVKSNNIDNLLHNLLQKKMTINLPGNFYLSSGSILEINAKSFSLNSDITDSTDKTMSGKYLIIATRHMINPQKHETFCEIATDSTNVGAVVATNSSLQKSKYI